MAVGLRVEASTWKTRGMLLYDVEGTIRKKLLQAGFTVAREGEDPKGGVLAVTYNESKGSEYAFNAFGTIITATFHFVTNSSAPALEFSIQEISSNSVSGIPPYLDVIHRFETHPYYYFLGDILAGHTLMRSSLDDALWWAFQRALASRGDPDGQRDSSERLEHSMMPPQEFYRPFAFQRTIQLFMDRHDARIARLWPDLLNDPDPIVRMQTMKMIQHFRVGEAQGQVVKLAAQDADPRVRTVAQQTAKFLHDTP